jgi:hypothetical protein
MPTVINMGGKSEPPGKSKDNTPAGGPPKNTPLIAAIVAGILVLGLFVFLWRTYVSTPTHPPMTKVAPPPGFPDQWPYNTKEWQQQTNNGQLGGRLSGVPPIGQAGMTGTPAPTAPGPGAGQ